jgi:hypothetical protein
VAVGGTEARVVTNQVWTRDQWQALNPATMHAYRYNGRYLAFYDGGSFAFTPGQGVEFYDTTASAGYYDIYGDILYLVQGADITQWDRGTPLTFTWLSRIHEIPPGSASFNCGKVIAYTYPVQMTVYADGETVLTLTVQSPNMFRMPAGFTLARDWEVKLQGVNEIASVQLATSPGELV